MAGCATPSGPAPSLAPRAAEAIDPRVPVVTATTPQMVNPALVRRLADLVAQARNGENAFVIAAGEAQRLAAASGEPQSENWIVAQEAVSAVVAARAPTTKALGDIDGIAATSLETKGGIAPADLAAIEAAAAEVGAIDRRQARTIKMVQALLAR